MNIYWKIGSYLIAIGLVLFGLHWYGSNRYDEGFAARDAIAAKLAFEEIGKARETERDWQNKLNEAQNAKTERENKLSADATASRTAAVKLRGDIAELQRRLSGLTEQAIRQYADAASNVLSECTIQYSELAETADRIDSDRQTLEDAWPK